MGLGSRGAWAVVALGVLLVMALLKVAVDSDDPAGSADTRTTVLLNRAGDNKTETVQHPGNSTEKPTPASSVPKTNATSKPTTRPTSTAPQVSTNKTSTTLKPVPSKVTTTGITTNKTTTTSKPAPRTSATPTTPQMNTTHNSTATSASAAAATPTINSKGNTGLKFDTGSFVGGIVLTLGILSMLYAGCKVYYSRRGIQYRTIDEHDAII